MASKSPAAKKKAVGAPPPIVEFFYDEVEQRSEEWFALRRGIPTASKFSVVMAEGRDGDESLSRAKYMDLLAGEIMSGITAETFQSEEMRRGVAMEPIARERYASARFDELVQVGFVRRRLPSGRYIGCSPDSQVGGRSGRKGLEIKSVAQHLMIRLLDGPAGGFPPKFRAQVQGTMLVTGWVEMDLMLYSEGMPDLQPFYVPRDEPYIKKLSDQLEVFDYDLDQLVRKIREKSR